LGSLLSLAAGRKKVELALIEVRLAFLRSGGQPHGGFEPQAC
jgi:hypothetical protein